MAKQALSWSGRQDSNLLQPIDNATPDSDEPGHNPDSRPAKRAAILTPILAALALSIAAVLLAAAIVWALAVFFRPVVPGPDPLGPLVIPDKWQLRPAARRPKASGLTRRPKRGDGLCSLSVRQ